MKHNNIALLLLSHKIEQIAVHKTNVDYDYNVKISLTYNEKIDSLITLQTLKTFNTQYAQMCNIITKLCSLLDLSAN